MHFHAYRFFDAVVARLPKPTDETGEFAIVEIGSLDINDSVRGILAGEFMRHKRLLFSVARAPKRCLRACRRIACRGSLAFLSDLPCA